MTIDTLFDYAFALGRQLPPAPKKWIGRRLERHLTRQGRRSVARQLANDLAAANVQAKTAEIVYDNYSSPPTIGDFVVVVMLARLISNICANVRLTIIDGQYREDWGPLTTNEREQLVSLQQEIALRLLQEPKCFVQITTWDDYCDRRATQPGDYIFGRGLIDQRIPIYPHAFNTTNILWSKLPAASTSNFLLQPGDLDPNFIITSAPYITWHARHSTKWGADRNMTPDEFAYMRRVVQQMFPGTRIIIVSDECGCNFFRNLLSDYDTNISFSKDQTESIFQDVELILGSQLYIQYKGGGIGVFPIYAHGPMILIINSAQDEPWTKKQYASWHTPQQYCAVFPGFTYQQFCDRLELFVQRARPGKP